jgi:hypothetical protein
LTQLSVVLDTYGATAIRLGGLHEESTIPAPNVQQNVIGRESEHPKRYLDTFSVRGVEWR